MQSQIKNNLSLCIGIDPQPATSSFQSFSDAVAMHVSFLRHMHIDTRPKLKPNLSFFLRFGSQGIALLERFCTDHRDRFDIIIDAKFNEISNSLQAQLDFVFKHLGASGITINPYLGERTIELALSNAVQAVGLRARVYVLCATSEFSTTTLAYLQQPGRILESCVEVRTKVVGQEYPDSLGVVIGANRQDVLLSSELQKSGCAVLSPGLGAQGASNTVVAALRAQSNGQSCANEFVFPVSRAIFQGGQASVEDALNRFHTLSQLF